MGADQDVDLALREARHRLTLLGRRAEARDVLDRDRVVLQPLGERPVVLLGEDRRRHQQHHLLAVLDGLERRPQRDLGLAVADVAADQAVHRPRRLHVGLDELDRVALVGRLGERERVLELALPVGVGRERVALAALALGVQVQQLAGQLLRRPPRPRLDRVPARAAELGQRRVRAAGADEAADLRELVDGHEHAVGARVLEIQVVARDLRDRLGVEAGEPGDPVVLVDDDVAGAQVGEAAQHAAPARPVAGARRARRRRNSRCSGITARWNCGAMNPICSRAWANVSVRSAARLGSVPSSQPTLSRPRLYAARSPSPRRANATIVR